MCPVHLGSELKYVVVERPSGSARCSDSDCPCADAAISWGEGYLYVHELFVEAARKAGSGDFRKLADAVQALPGTITLITSGQLYPILMCETGARQRKLDLHVAVADAAYWWKTGNVPLRVTPRIAL